VIPPHFSPIPHEYRMSDIRYLLCSDNFTKSSAQFEEIVDFMLRIRNICTD
jgi:hypothetical protein